MKHVSGIFLLAASIVLGTSEARAEIDAPRWVAAIYVDAQRSVGLRWLPIPGAIAYNVYSSESSGGRYKMKGSVAQPQYFDNKDLEPGTTYYYVLRALNKSFQEGPESDEKAVTIPGTREKDNAVYERTSPPEDTKASALAPRGGFFRLPGFTSSDHPGNDVPTVDVGGDKYLYDRGVFWVARGGRFIVVAAPVGAEVDSLPPAAEKIERQKDSLSSWTGAFPGTIYYWFGGFFGELGGKYKVLASPMGAVVGYIPDGYERSTVEGKTVYTYKDTCFTPVTMQGTTMYQVCDCRR